MKKTEWKDERPAVVIILVTVILLMVGTVVVAWNMYHRPDVEIPKAPVVSVMSQSLEEES